MNRKFVHLISNEAEGMIQLLVGRSAKILLYYYFLLEPFILNNILTNGMLLCRIGKKHWKSHATLFVSIFFYYIYVTMSRMQWNVIKVNEGI